MNKHVLSIEEMRELKELGIDTSKASLFWVESFYFNEKDNYNRIMTQTISLIPTTNAIPTFTLQDILEMLPSFLYDKYTEKNAPLYLGKHENQYYISYDTMTIDEDEDNLYPHMEIRTYNAPVISFGLYHTPLEAAFNMLKWCKQNNYI